MSNRRLIKPGKYKNTKGFTPAIVYKDWIFTSAITAVNPATGEIPPAVAGNPAIPLSGEDRTYREVTCIYNDLKEIIGAAGGDLQNAVRLDQYPVSREIMDAHHYARRGILHPPRAASTSVAIGQLLSPAAQISIEILGLSATADFRKEGINSDKIPQPVAGYAPAIRAGDFVFVAGQLPTDWTNPIAPEAYVDPDFWSGNRVDREARYILKNIDLVLQAAGSSLANVVKVHVHLRHMDDLPRLDHVWRDFFPKDPPARTIFPVDGLGVTDARLEITVIAVTNDGKTKKQTIASPKCRQPIFHESLATRAGDLLFLSGLMAADQSGLAKGARPHPNLPYDADTAALQMADILAQAQAICEAAGTDLRRCLRVLNVHRDITQHSRTRAVQQACFTDGMPTTSAIGLTQDLPVPGCTLMADFWVAMTD